MKKSNSRLPIEGYLFLIGTAFFTSISYLIARYLFGSLNFDIAVFYWFFMAFVFALLVAPSIPSQRRELLKFGSYWKIFIYSGILTSIGASLWMTSIWTIGPALTSFLMKAQTLFSLMLGIIFLGERLNRGESIGIVLTIIGLVIVAYHRDSYLIFGTVAALASAFFYSFLSFIVKKIANDLNMLTVATLRTLGVSVVLFSYLIISGKLSIPSPVHMVYIALGGISGAYIAKACQFQSIKLLDVSRSTAVMPLESLFVIILSFIIFDELPSLLKMLGGAGIIIGVIFLVVFRAEKNEALRE